jgi:hypothetical protein
MKNYFISLCFITACCSTVLADRPARWMLSTTPQYIVNNSLKFGLERNISRTNWAGVSLEVYYGPVNTDNSAYGSKSDMVKMGTVNEDMISGIGFGITDKIFVGPEIGYTGFYMGYGINYHYLSIDYKDYTWTTYQKDGLNYYGYDLSNSKLTINRYSAIIGFGYAVVLSKDFRADFFLGGAVTKSQSVSSLGDNYRSFKRDFWDYQYSGAHPVLSVQFGYLF